MSTNIILYAGTLLSTATSTNGSLLSERTLDLRVLDMPAHDRNAIRNATVMSPGFRNAAATMRRGRVGSASTTSAARIRGPSAQLKYPAVIPVVTPSKAVTAAARNPTSSVARTPNIHWLNTSCPMFVVPNQKTWLGCANDGPTGARGSKGRYTRLTAERAMKNRA